METSTARLVGWGLALEYATLAWTVVGTLILVATAAQRHSTIPAEESSEPGVLATTPVAAARNARYILAMGWLLLTYRLPADRSSARVAVWREVRRAGALQLQQSVVAFPDSEGFRRAAARVRAVVADVGGTVVAVRAEPLEGEDESRLVSAWNEARAAEYVELTGEAEKLVAEIDKEFANEKFTLAELDEEEAELEKLNSWHERIKLRDVHGCDRADEADTALARASEAVGRFTAAVFDRTHG